MVKLQAFPHSMRHHMLCAVTGITSSADASDATGVVSSASASVSRQSVGAVRKLFALLIGVSVSEANKAIQAVATTPIEDVAAGWLLDSTSTQQRYRRLTAFAFVRSPRRVLVINQYRSAEDPEQSAGAPHQSCWSVPAAQGG